MLMNKVSLILINKLKNIYNLNVKVKEIWINELEWVWIIIINKSSYILYNNYPFFKLNITVLTDILCK